MFQAFNLVPTLSAVENITLPGGTRRFPSPTRVGWTRSIDAVGLGDRLQHRPSELSGGQQQRVAVARALASRPEIIFADEPTGNLDSRTGAETLGFMRRAVDEMGQSIVMVTHDPVAAAHADEVLFLADGRIVDRMGSPPPSGCSTCSRPWGSEVVMLSITLKSTWAHKRRLTGTVLAVVVGIAFLSGTLVLGDAMRAGFEDLFTDVYAGTDAVVRGEDTIGSDAVAQQALLDRSRGGRRGCGGRGRRRRPIPRGRRPDRRRRRRGHRWRGPPTLAGSWIDQPELNPYSIVEGRAPAGPGEVAIDRTSAETGGLAIGDTVVVRMPAPVEARIVGLIEPDGGADFGGVSFAAFTLDEAQQYLAGGADVVSQVIVAAADGVSQDDLVQRLLPIIPDGAEAVSGTDLTDEATDGISADFLDFFEAFLLAFAGIALLVAGFSIYNTFSITLAQRSRESALMRAIGSSSRQILGSVALEAVIVGVVASVIGLVAGLGLAVGLAAVLGAVGFGIPTAGR